MKKMKYKRRTALLLAFALIVGVMPFVPDNAVTVQAADGSMLSVTAFATKDELMAVFTPDENGASSTIGKLAFGKNSGGATQEWYILGRDSDVAGDNTVLFAAGPIVTGQKFNNIAPDPKSYDFKWGCAYTGEAPKEVYANHYGGSDVRAKLNEIAGDTDYFTTEEQGLMNETTVTTYDANTDADYTTTDKLYALTAEVVDYNDISTNTTIKAGTNDQIMLAMSTYWSSSGSQFWLRTPIYTSYEVMEAAPGFFVSFDVVNSGYALVPAFELDLSSVIFASAAKGASSGTAKSGRIDDGTAMTLRLDGSDQTIGTVIYDKVAGKIAAQKNAGAAGTVSLVVQGNDGTNDWYYSVQAGDTTVVTKEQIQTACNISGDMDLADCKIWLETTIDNVTYARMAEEGTIATPTAPPTEAPTAEPTVTPTAPPTEAPTAAPTVTPTTPPTEAPTAAPTVTPTTPPTEAPTAEPTVTPTTPPTEAPTAEPTVTPTTPPTEAPTAEPTVTPTAPSTEAPTAEPTVTPTPPPTEAPTAEPTVTPTAPSTEAPTEKPTIPNPDESVSPEEATKNLEKLDFGASAKWKGNTFMLSWATVRGAEGYDIFAAKCGKKLNKKSLTKTVKKKKTSASLRKIAGKKISGKKGYKFRIKAWKKIGGKKVYIGKSMIYHVARSKNKKYTNAKKLVPTKRKYALKKGKKVRLKVRIVKQSKKKKLLPHGPALRYRSNNKKVATVTSNGKVIAKGKGSCYIYVSALNGIRVKIRITVK